jgi:hypothetical protein
LLCPKCFIGKVQNFIFGFGNDILNITPKAQAIKGKKTNGIHQTKKLLQSK